jgi:hypothetical protein
MSRRRFRPERIVNLLRQPVDSLLDVRGKRCLGSCDLRERGGRRGGPRRLRHRPSHRRVSASQRLCGFAIAHRTQPGPSSYQQEVPTRTGG